MVKDIIKGAISNLLSDFVLRLFKRKEKPSQYDKKNQETHKFRPEMEIVTFKDYTHRPGYGIKKKCDAELFVAKLESVMVDKINGRDVVNAHYYQGDWDGQNWCCSIYTFKNVGQTNVSTVDIYCNNKRSTCIFSPTQAESWMNLNFLNYSYCYDKKIRVGETFTVKICYYKDRVMRSPISANLSLGMRDDNGRYWVQPLFAPAEKIYDSRAVSAKEYMKEINTDVAEECFKNSVLW